MQSSEKPYLTTLTPLRGIAALIVVIFHCNLMLESFLPFGESNVITAGWLWVDFFFVLSGFIISYVYGDSFKGSLTTDTYWKYIKARFARVYPLHFVTMVWSLICAVIIIYYANGIAPFFWDMLNPMTAIPSAFLIQSLGIYSAAPLNTPSWSLSTEWWMYMIFPLLVPFFFRIKTFGRILTLAGIAGIFLFIKYYLTVHYPPFPGAPPSLDVVADFGMIRCAGGFFLGMLLFVVYQDSLGLTFFKKSWVFVALFAGSLVAMQLNVEDILIVIFFPLIILAAAYNTTVIKKILDTPILQRLGDWSFSIYMVHVPIMYIFWINGIINNPTMLAKFPPESSGPPNYTQGLIKCAVVVTLTLVVAALMYRYVEVPARNYLNKRSKSKRLETVGAS